MRKVCSNYGTAMDCLNVARRVVPDEISYVTNEKGYWEIVIDGLLNNADEPNLLIEPSLAAGPMIEVGETSRGYTLYRQTNGVGGYTYWSDEIGSGVMVWDTALVGLETLQLAIKVETNA